MIAALLVGVAFGWLLDRGGLTRYGTIAGVYRLTDLTVLKFLGSAIVAGTVAVELARALGLAAVVPVVPTNLAADAVGGALFGVGMAIAGFCPGTVLAGAAGGRLDYLVAGGGGLVAGALAYAWAWPAIGALGRVGAYGALTLPSLVGARGGLVVALLVELAAFGCYAVERHVPRAPRRHKTSTPVPSMPSRSSV